MTVPHRTPQRTCVGCRDIHDKRELIRIVRMPQGEVAVDPTSKKAGRGAYLCPRQECLDAARKSKALERALEIQIVPEVWERLGRDLAAGVPLNPVQVKEQKKKK